MWTGHLPHPPREWREGPELRRDTSWKAANSSVTLWQRWKWSALTFQGRCEWLRLATDVWAKCFRHCRWRPLTDSTDSSSTTDSIIKNKEALLVLKYLFVVTIRSRGLVTGLPDGFILGRKRHPHLFYLLLEGMFYFSPLLRQWVAAGN